MSKLLFSPFSLIGGILVPALVLEGAIFRAVRGLFDHGFRQAFQKLTGSWPGNEHPEPA